MAWLTVEEANSYFAESLDSVKWEQVTNKSGAINSAFRILSKNPNWVFPEIVSQNMKDANAEFALFLWNNQGNKRIDLQNQNVESFSIGDFSESFGKNDPTGPSKQFFPENVKDLLSEYSNSASSFHASF